MEYEERTVIVADILGFANAVARSDSDRSFFRRVAHGVIGIHAEGSRVEVARDRGGEDSVSARWVSDVIVLTASPSRPGLRVLLQYYQELFWLLLFSARLPLRAGAARGMLFESGQVVFGPALARAAKLESESAVFPRLVFEEGLIGEDDAHWLSKGAPPSRCHSVERDFDDRMFLNPLGRNIDSFARPFVPAEADASKAAATRFRRVSQVGVGRHRCRSSVRRKYEWMNRIVRSYELRARG